MKVEFESFDGKRRIIGESDNWKDANKIITSFLKDHNYKSYYWRYTLYDDSIWIDVGSHTEFFWITDIEPNKRLEEIIIDKT